MLDISKRDEKDLHEDKTAQNLSTKYLVKPDEDQIFAISMKEDNQSRSKPVVCHCKEREVADKLKGSQLASMKLYKILCMD